ncbi:MAG TPA: ABC transporter permease [Mucilaginibacter sp.]|nr:ABC transporter permease [Mucilaginibacter sp.]
MLKNYFKITVRSLLKNRSYSFLNIAGLSIGIACASLIFLWVQDELSFNSSFKNRNDIYTVYENQTYNGKISTFHATPGPFARSVKAEIPGIKYAAQIGGIGDMVFALGDKIINEKGSYADPEMFSILDMPFVYGSVEEAFKELHSVVISETMARKFFGDTNPVGRSLKMNNEQNFTVTGVFKDFPKNSTLQFDWMAPQENISHLHPWMQEWGANWARTYIQLQPNANVDAINKQLRGYIGTKITGNTTQCFLFNMNDWNLHDNFENGHMTGGRITYVRLFAIIAVIILVIACINFMNLSTARSEQRAREVGVRKVMGAGKGRLIAQFIGEAMTMSFLAVVTAVCLIYLILPSFNDLVQKQLPLDMLAPKHLTYLLTIGVVTGFFAGSYPAFYLSSFNPISVLKNIKIKSNSSSALIRQSLVVMQFTASIILIIGTIVIYQQIQHVKNRRLGYDKNNLIYINTQGKMGDHFNSIYHDLKQSGVVEYAALSDYPVLQIWNNTDNFSWAGKDPSANPLITWEDVSPQFLHTQGIKLADGRDFYADPTLDSTNVIINKSLARQMGKEGHIGGVIRRGGEQAYTIVGIMDDFLYNDMYASSAPLLLYSHPQNTNVLSIRFKSGVDVQQALQKISPIMKRDNPGYPFEYKFIDEDFNELFKTENLTGKLAGVFAGLAIFISCLGLFGLAAYTAERRIKEISIRKVLGASVAGLAGLLSKDFLRLVGLACVIAFPAAWLMLSKWLQGYQYRISLNWTIFAVAGVTAIVIALLTVSYQAVKAALSNPVKCLRSE